MYVWKVAKNALLFLSSLSACWTSGASKNRDYLDENGENKGTFSFVNLSLLAVGSSGYLGFLWIFDKFFFTNVLTNYFE